MSTLYKIELAPAAERQLKKLPELVRMAIIKRLESLKLNPSPMGVQKLSMLEDLYRIRVRRSQNNLPN